MSVILKSGDEFSAWLARRRLNFAFDELDHVSDARHLLDLFGRKPYVEFLLQRQNQVQVLQRIPGVNHFGCRCERDFVRGQSENVGSRGANLIRDVQWLPPFPVTSFTHSGEAIRCLARPSTQRAPSPFRLAMSNPCCL